MSRRLRAPLLICGAWTGIALLFTLYVMLPSPAAGDRGEWIRAAGWQLVTWGSWAGWTPLVVVLARRLVSVGPAHRLIAAHVLAGLAVSLLCTALQGALRWRSFSGVRMRYDVVGPSSLPMADQWSFNLVVYAMVVGVFYVWCAGRLEAQLARARARSVKQLGVGACRKGTGKLGQNCKTCMRRFESVRRVIPPRSPSVNSLVRGSGPFIAGRGT